MPKIVAALTEAYNADRAKSEVAREFAMQFDVEHVWETGWMPFLKDLFK